jgi:hypothetical protein
MCLFAKTKRLIVAKEDIKCYKRFTFFINSEEIKFVTPYQWTIVPTDVLLGKQEFSALGGLEAKKGEKGEYTIFGGVIHTYAYERDACENQCSDELVVACIIPKGTKYIEGHDGWGCKTIAAQTIKVDAGFKDEKEIKEAAVKVENWFKKMYGR